MVCSEHLAGAADKSCDHWHDGAGLMVHHAAFTRVLESVLQLIEPSVSVPYWEYAKDQWDYKEEWRQVDALYKKITAHSNALPTHMRCL